VNATLDALAKLTEVLLASNAAIPVIFGVIGGIAATIRGITGEGPTPTELADLIDAQVAANDEFGKAEVARLRALIGG
jgi:hypothetical protein